MEIKLKVAYADSLTNRKYKPGEIINLPEKIAQTMIKNDMGKIQKRVKKPEENRENT